VNHFRSLVSHFKRSLPEYKISVRRVVVPAEYYAFTQKLADKHFRISVGSSMEEPAQIGWLVHEIAHVISWHKDKHHSQHGKHFGIAYSKAWQIYLSWMKL